MKHLLLVLAATAAASVAIIGCSGGGNCSAANCSGCCTANGQCVTGNTTSECGRQGASCTACTSGQACAGNTCVASMGGGGGAMGGGGGSMGGGTGGGATGGGGGGGQVTCTDLDFTTGTTQLGGAYNPQAGMRPAYHVGAIGKPSATQGRFDFLGVELWYLTAPTVTFPYTVTLNGTTWETCEGCVYLDQGCDNAGNNCTGFYLAQQGTLTYTAGTQNQQAGTFTGSGNMVELREWVVNDMEDRAVPNGRCVRLNYTLNVSWDAGQTTDAGMDGGTDAGMTDAGMTDAGLDAGLLDGGLGLDAGLDAGLDGGLDASVP